MAFSILAFACLLMTTACRRESGGTEETGSAGRSVDKIAVIVSVEPQTYLVERIGGDHVVADILVPNGREPETYQPSPETVARLARSKIYFRIGFAFEESLLSKLNAIAPRLEVVDFRRGVSMRPMELHSHGEEELAGHSHELHAHELHAHAEHSHESEVCADADGRDVHTWMGTSCLKRQAATVCDTLSAVDPDNASTYRSNREKLDAEIDRLHERIAKELAPYRGRTVYVFHPAYGYLCDEFGLTQRAVEFEGRAPRPRELVRWIDSVSTESRPTIFVQPQFNHSAAGMIAKSTGGRVVVHSTLGPNPLESIAEFVRLFVESESAPER